MDRFTWGIVGGVLLLAAVAFAVVVVNRAPEGPPDLTTADGTVRAYIAAIHDRRAEEAWRLLASPSALDPQRGPGGGAMTETDFQRQVNGLSRPNDRRIRVLPPRVSDQTATVDVEIVTSSDAPFMLGGGPHSRRTTFSLRRTGEEWRITTSPSVWEIG